MTHDIPRVNVRLLPTAAKGNVAQPSHKYVPNRR
jgi:hypothetical protein